MRPLFSKKDIGIFAVLVLTALILYIMFAPSGRYAETAEISVNGQLAFTADLSRDAEFSPEQVPAVLFSVQDGAIAFIRSDCPDKYCIRGGYLRHPGQAAVCLPNRVSVYITGRGGTDEPDMVAG